MRRAAIYPFLGPALVLYLLADLSAAPGALDLLGFVIAALAVLLSAALLVRVSESDERGMSRVGWLGFAISVALLRLVPTDTLDLSVEEACALALAGVGALVLDLALRVPDSLVPTRYSRVTRVVPYALGAAAASLSVLAVGPVLVPFGAPWLVPERYADSALVFAGVSVLLALGLRVVRRRMGSTPEALASNAWAVLGLLPVSSVLLLAALAPVFPGFASLIGMRVLGGASAAALYLGHLWMVDPRRRLSAGHSIRELFAAAISGALLAAFVVPLRRVLPGTSLALAMWVAASFVVGLVLFRALLPLSHRWLAPFGGRLLAELRGFPNATGSVHSLMDLARVELAAMRRGSGVPTALPLLYAFDPAIELRIDAAGEAHRSERQLHPAILEQLRVTPGEIILRAPLEAQIVRQPRLRPLVLALAELDALCVLPLVSDGELEGALCIPRGSRRAPLSLEELDALREHSAWLTALLAVFCAQGRIAARSGQLIVEHERAEASVERLEDELARTRGDLELLHAGGAAATQASALIAYSPAMRTLLDRLRSIASHDVPLLLHAERGLPVEALARFVHTESGRGQEPFIRVSCAGLRADEGAAVLFGGMHRDTRHAGALRVAGAGSVLLTDVAALALDAQRALAVAIASRSARTVDGAQTYALQARVIVSSQVDLELLAAASGKDAGSSDAHHGCDAELASRLVPAALRVAPLRERREDIGSHALVAVDRACRRLGRATLGLAPEALEALTAHDLPGNVVELESLIERAVMVCRAERIQLADLPIGDRATASATDTLEGTLEEVECRALQHALARALGNKSEAARLLGLPRTTFLDKLRRHKLDDGARESSFPAN